MFNYKTVRKLETEIDHKNALVEDLDRIMRDRANEIYKLTSEIEGLKKENSRKLADIESANSTLGKQYAEITDLDNTIHLLTHNLVELGTALEGAILLLEDVATVAGAELDDFEEPEELPELVDELLEQGEDAKEVLRRLGDILGAEDIDCPDCLFIYILNAIACPEEKRKKVLARVAKELAAANEAIAEEPAA
jgi:chromosome segregation ATPase